MHHRLCTLASCNGLSLQTGPPGASHNHISTTITTADRCALPFDCPCCALQPPLSTLPQFYFPTKAPRNEAESATKELVASIDKSFASNASGLQLLDFVEAVHKVRAQQQGRKDKGRTEGWRQKAHQEVVAVTNSTQALSRHFIGMRLVFLH